MRGYVAKLGLVCSPSVSTGEPVFSKRSMVSRSAAAYSSSSAVAAIFCALKVCDGLNQPRRARDAANWLCRNHTGIL